MKFFDLSRASVIVLASAAVISLSACEKNSPPAQTAAPASVAELKPYEPLDPAKAQVLPESALSITSGGTTHRFTVEFADDDAERSIGLMHRAQMAADHGMLFDFMSPRRVGFWMRNTFIPLDMLFVKSDGEIVYIAENVAPHVETPVGPERPVRAVLELNGGLAQKLGLKVGDVVHHAAFNNGP